ncbi:MAG: PAS domain S-box protein [Halodesulfurarchaeum sp.]
MSQPTDSIVVVVVDDEPGLPDLVARNLEGVTEQLDVLTAHSVSDAKSILEDESVDCIIADYALPEENGIDFLEHVRADRPNLPYILFTGKGSEEIASDAISKGVTDYFKKGRIDNQWPVLANRIQNAVELSRSQQALETRNRELQTYEAMVHSMLESACIYDEDARFDIVNENLADWYGKPRAELEGEKSNLIPLVRAQHEGDPYQELLNGEREKVDGRVEAEFEGHGVAVLEYRCSPLRVNGSIEGVVGVTRDITERARRTEELQQAFEEYQDLFNGMNDTAWVLGTDGTFRTVNDAAVETLGYSREELLSMQPADIDAKIEPDEIRGHIEEMSQDEIQVLETVHEARDGTRIPVELSSSLITYREEPAILSIGRDISSRKEREKRLEEFASVVSHDLRNPLNVAQGRLELAQETCKSDHLEAIEDAHDRMQSLIDDLLTLAREGEPVPESESVDLETVVEESWQNVETADGTLEMALESSITADPSRLRQVFENLIRNAIEHNDSAVTISIGEMEYGFYVEDDGAGIPEGDRERLFEAGFSTTPDGTGFGLRIVEQIVEAHGWKIAVTESEAGGARFEISGVNFTP